MFNKLAAAAALGASDGLQGNTDNSSVIFPYLTVYYIQGLVLLFLKVKLKVKPSRSVSPPLSPPPLPPVPSSLLQ